MEEKFLKLTNAVYKLLEYFPESDPLKNRAKDKVLAIMENLVLINETSGWASFQKEKAKVQLSEDIDVLLGYFGIAKSQNWLSAVNCLIISNEYEIIKKDIEPAIELTQKLPGIEEQSAPKESAKTAPESVLDNYISERQEKILEFLNKSEKAQVMDLKTVLPNVTKRTIRRDLDELLRAGKIARFGEFNQVFYKVDR